MPRPGIDNRGTAGGHVASRDPCLGAVDAGSRLWQSSACRRSVRECGSSRQACADAQRQHHDHGLRQSLSVQREQAAPRLLGLRLVVDLRIRRAPAVRGARVDLDFRRQVRLGERLFQHGLVVGRARVVVLGDRDQELRLGLRRLQVRAVRRRRSRARRRGTRRPRRRDRAPPPAVRNAIGPPMQ